MDSNSTALGTQDSDKQSSLNSPLLNGQIKRDYSPRKMESWRQSGHAMLKIGWRRLVQITVKFLQGFNPKTVVRRARGCCAAGFSDEKKPSTRLIDTGKPPEQVIKEFFAAPVEAARTPTANPGSSEWSQLEEYYLTPSSHLSSDKSTDSEVKVPVALKVPE